MNLGDLTGREDRFAGALLGTACGDALGAPVEGDPNPGEVRDFLRSPRGFGCYTDDTQMTLALAESLVRCRGINGEDCARAYAEHFDSRRGYGAGTLVLLQMLRRGADYRRTGTALFPDGSFGNGAAMRIAPVGLLYGAGRATNLRDAVLEAARCTHVHPLAVDGAVVQARLVGVLSRAAADERPSFADLEGDLLDRVTTREFGSRISELARLLEERAPNRDAARRLGTGITALEAVPTAVWSAFRQELDPEEAVVRAVAMGGDTDTIGAMTGALVGALHGASRLPRRWLENLENGPGGRDRLVQVARDLAGIFSRKR